MADNNGSLYSFDFSGKTFLVDIHLPCVYEVDDLTKDVALLMDQGKDRNSIAADLNTDVQSIELVYRELLKLEKEELLFTPSRKTPPSVADRDITEYTIHVTNKCNFDCRYCYARGEQPTTTDSLLYSGKVANMDRETAKAAVDFIVEQSADNKRVRIALYGGEPLINWDIIKFITNYTNILKSKTGKMFELHITSNASLLSREKSRFLAKNNYIPIFSLDGPPSFHDSNRLFRSGEPTSEIVFENICAYLEEDMNSSYRVRATYTSDTCGSLIDFHNFFKDKGLFRYSLEPIMCAPDSELSIKPEQMALLARSHEIWARQYVEDILHGIPVSNYQFEAFLVRLNAMERNAVPCCAGTGYQAISPAGEIYPCHCFMDFEEYRIGDVFKKEIDIEKRNSFLELIVDNREKCARCWARFLCGGACYREGYFYSQNPSDPSPAYCHWRKTVIKTCAYIYRELETRMPDFETFIFDNISQRSKDMFEII